MSNRRSRGPSYYKRLAAEDAARRGLSEEEYGVYKGDVGSGVKPVNSAGGLLAISIAMTVICLFIAALCVILVLQAQGVVAEAEKSTELSPAMWFFVALIPIFTVWSWLLYRKERRAQKLRMARGLPRTLG